MLTVPMPELFVPFVSASVLVLGYCAARPYRSMGVARLVLTKRRVSKLFLIPVADVPTCVGVEIFLSIGIARPPPQSKL